MHIFEIKIGKYCDNSSLDYLNVALRQLNLADDVCQTSAYLFLCFCLESGLCLVVSCCVSGSPVPDVHGGHGSDVEGFHVGGYPWGRLLAPGMPWAWNRAVPLCIPNRGPCIQRGAGVFRRGGSDPLQPSPSLLFSCLWPPSDD